MSEFDYLAVLISIVLGLGISQLLGSGAQLVRYRSAVRFYTPTLVWLAILFLAHIQIWWAVFELRNVPDWSFVEFGLVLLLPTVAYLMSVLVAPDFDREQEVDLKASYFEHRVWFFGLFAALPAISLLQEYVIRGSIVLDGDPAFRIAFVGLGILGMLSANEKVHWLVAVAVLGSFSIYIGLLFLQLA